MDKTFFTTMLVLLLAGCAANAPHRTTVYADALTVDPTALQAHEQECHWDGGLASASTNPYVVSPRCQRASIETTDRYTLFFVEFDEQGRLYKDEQYRQLFRYLDQRVKCRAALSIVVFVHGWRHDAHFDDPDVDLARNILAFTDSGERSERRTARPSLDVASAPGCPQQPSVEGGPREVVGLYVGWRGKSLDGGTGLFKNIEILSVLDRKDAAENIAVGSVRELFSRLRVFQERQNQQVAHCDPDTADYACKRVRMLIVGHSFGGLMVFNAISGSIMDSLNQGAGIDSHDPDNCRTGVSPDQVVPAVAPGPEADDRRNARTRTVVVRDSALVKSFADLVVLINPAIEGARFEPLHQALQRRIREVRAERAARGDPVSEDASVFCAGQKPVLVVVTADNDFATKRAFPFMRSFATWFRRTDPERFADDETGTRNFVRHGEEVDASVMTMGHVDRFTTHFMWTSNDRQPSPLCNDGIASSPLEAARRSCRCGDNRWTEYVRAHAADRCAALVEEINAAEAEPDRNRQTVCGGAMLVRNGPYVPPGPSGTPSITAEWAKTYRDADNPFWIIRSENPAIIDGHNGISSDPFKFFIRQLYHDITVVDAAKSAAVAVAAFERDCTRP